MKKTLARTGWTILTLVIASFIALVSWEPFFARQSETPPAHQYRAEIIRDEFGVPHIYGHTDADVGARPVDQIVIGRYPRHGRAQLYTNTQVFDLR